MVPLRMQQSSWHSNTSSGTQHDSLECRLCCASEQVRQPGCDQHPAAKLCRPRLPLKQPAVADSTVLTILAATG